MPCAASPPSTFCQDHVTTSSLSQGSAMANAAEVASQMVSPARSAGDPVAVRDAHAGGGAVPGEHDVVGEVDLRRGPAALPYSAPSTRASGSLSCLTTSVAQPSPKLSKASTSTGRAPSRDQSAISTAPVSEAGTMPTRQSAGMPRMARDRSITSASCAFGPAARCERPSNAASSAPSEKPGRLAQGPDEKLGLAGRRSGFAASAMSALPCRREAPRWGGVTRRGK